MIPDIRLYTYNFYFLITKIFFLHLRVSQSLECEKLNSPLNPSFFVNVNFWLTAFYAQIIMLDSINELSEREDNFSEEMTDDEVESMEQGDVLLPLTYFNHSQDSSGYSCKQDIINKVKLFNDISKRTFKVATSNAKRYRVFCTVADCKFQLNFYFENGITFCKPKIAVQHTCSMYDHDPTGITPSSLVQRPWVQEWMKKELRAAETKGLKRECANNGIQVPYNTLFRTLQLLRKQYFIRDVEQYEYLESYTTKLNEKEQFASLEKEDIRFHRWCVIYREGLQGMRACLRRGLQLDGTFIKNATGGTCAFAS